MDTIDCLSKSTFVEQCRYVASTTPDRLERAYRRIDKRDSKMSSVDIDRLVCPYLPICDPIVDGQVVRRDGTHVTAAFASVIAPKLEAYLQDVRVLPRR
jgi:hypothetical protein